MSKPPSTSSVVKYASTQLTEEVRNLLGALTLAWREEGRPRAEFVTLLESVGFRVPKTTLNGWAASVEAQGSVLRAVKKSGNVRLLGNAETRAC
jgi:hypothetical protein